jgi:outer membrane immunogenic protein
VGGLPFATAPSVAGSDTEHPSGFIGGGQIGYNWQYSPLIVVGLEADFQGALERDTNNLSQPFSAIEAGALVTSTALTNYTTQIDWFGTVRGRIGYVWGTNGDVLTYVTGGLAYGEVKINGTNNTSGTPTGVFCPCAPFSSIQTFGHSQVNTGWTIGSGTEGKLLIPGWTYRIEYLYMDLGTLNTTSAGSISCGPPGCNPGFLTGGQVTTHSHFTDGILRAGVNYQFH